MRHRTAIVVTAAALLLAACGGTDEIPADLAGQGDGGATGGDAATVTCGGTEYAPATSDDAPPVTSLPAGPAHAADDAGQPAFDPSQDWRVVHESEDRVDLVRELDEPTDLGGGDIRTHESRTLERVTGATNMPDGTWLLTSAGPCAQQVDADGAVGPAGLLLATEPSPDQTTIDLLVIERACASGQSAEGRVELVELEETDDQVRLHIGVRPYEPEGDATGVTCQGNPPTPFTVELAEPLGDRQVVDVSVVPARALTVHRGPEASAASVDDGTVEAALSWEPPSSYVLELETVYPGPDNLKRVTVEDGQVVRREVIDTDGAVVGPATEEFAPSLGELLDRLRTAYAEHPASITQIEVDPTTQALTSVAFDPTPDTSDDDQVGFVVLEITSQ